MRRGLLAIAVVSSVVVAIAALIQAAVAVGALAIGDEPGQGATGQEWSASMAIVVLLAAGTGLAALALGERSSSIALVAPIAAALFVVTAVSAYDPYYAPSLRRPVDGPDWSVVVNTGVVVGGATISLALARRLPRLALVVGATTCIAAAVVVIGSHLH